MEHLTTVILLLRMEQALMLTDPRGAYHSMSCIAAHMHDSQPGCEGQWHAKLIILHCMSLFHKCFGHVLNALRV